MLAAWCHCGPQLWAVLVTLRDFAYSTESAGGELAVQLNRREKVVLQGEKYGEAKHCLAVCNVRLASTADRNLKLFLQ